MYIIANQPSILYVQTILDGMNIGRVAKVNKLEELESVPVWVNDTADIFELDLTRKII